MPRFTVKRNPVEYLLDPGTPLLWALRDASHPTGAKYGCDDASCGACPVIADGEAVRACTVSITAMEGPFITTIEALSPARSPPLQQAFQIGRASCRERVCTFVSISVVAVPFKTKKTR